MSVEEIDYARLWKDVSPFMDRALKVWILVENVAGFRGCCLPTINSRFQQAIGKKSREINNAF